MGTSEKGDSDIILPAPRSSGSFEGKVEETDDEVFKKSEGKVDFRTVGWIPASVIFLKVIFATGVLSIPSALFNLGALPGGIMIVFWGFVNTYCAIILGNFRNRHAGCHSIADMAGVLGGLVFKEIVGGVFMIAYTICVSSGLLGASVGLNALSNHATCTNYFTLAVTILCFLLASFRKFEKIAWLTWAGFISVYVAVFIVVVGVTTVDRPASAPQTGPYELGYHVVASPDFIGAVTAVVTIFVSSSGNNAFMPVISEMRNPKDYNKAVYVCMSLVTVSYLAFSLVVYRWCGQWVASPSLGSAGSTIKKVSYGVALIGLLVSACLYLHVAAKYMFVRILRNSVHLQNNSLIHWGVWLGCTFTLAAVGFIIASGVPIFNYLISLVGGLFFAPLSLILPGCFWVYDHQHYWTGSALQKVVYLLHWLLMLVGAFLCVSGTYGTVQQIKTAYATGAIAGAFSCADNSNSS